MLGLINSFLVSSSLSRILHTRKGKREIMPRIKLIKTFTLSINDVFSRLTQALIVFHEELMEEIYDWINDTEKQAESIAVNEDNINSVMEEYRRHTVIPMFY